MARRRYRNAAPASTLTGGVNAAATSLVVVAVTGWPVVFPFTAVVDYGLPTIEVVLVTNVVGTTLTATRGYDGTTGVSHSAGATVQPMATAIDYDEANAHMMAATGVHGLSGTLVGTTDVQTLSNKTLSSPVLTGTATAAAITASGAVSAASAAISGAATAASVTATGTVQGATVAATGNATVGGTLGVTGVSTLGAVNSGSQAVTGNETVSGTLGVTGVTTLGVVNAASGTVTAAPGSGTAIANRDYVDSSPAAVCVQAAGQSVATSTYVPVTFSAEVMKDQITHSTSVNTSRFTPTKAGYYRVSGHVILGVANTAGIRLAEVRKNGAAVAGGTRIHSGQAGVNASPSATFDMVVQCNGTTDYIEVAVFQDSGGSLTTATSAGQASAIVISWFHA